MIEHLLREHKYARLQTPATRFDGSLSILRRARDHRGAKGVVRRLRGGASLVERAALTQNMIS